MSFKVTLLDLGNIANLDAHKRKKEKSPDEVFVSITWTPENPEIKFEGESTPDAPPAKPSPEPDSPH
jgi:hypothetical protein